MPDLLQDLQRFKEEKNATKEAKNATKEAKIVSSPHLNSEVKNSHKEAKIVSSPHLNGEVKNFTSLNDTTLHRAVGLLREAWRHLFSSHEALWNTGEENTPEAIAARKQIMADREPWIERYNSLYTGKEAFMQGTMTEQQLQLIVNGQTYAEATRKPAPKTTPQAAHQLSDLKLAAKIRATKQAIIRAKNQLQYQQDTSASTPNPLPPCPRRTALEKKLLTKEQELQALQAELAKRL